MNIPLSDANWYAGMRSRPLKKPYYVCSVTKITIEHTGAS